MFTKLNKQQSYIYIFSTFQVVPGTLELVRESQCGCSVAEVLRMERVVLNKLEWNVHLVTPLQFLHIVSCI